MTDRPLGEVNGRPPQQLLDGGRRDRGVVHPAVVGLSEPLERAERVVPFHERWCARRSRGSRRSGYYV